MPNFEVEYYEKSDGSYPVEQFILEQPIKMQARIFRCIDYESRQ